MAPKTKKPGSLRVSKISIKNVLGIEDLSFTPGTVTVFSGSNKTNKTSALQAVMALVKGRGGHDPTILHQGAESGEVLLVFNNGETWRKTITDTASELEIEHPRAGTIATPATRIKDLIDLPSLNPIEFLTAPAKQRVNVLLEAIPLRLGRDQLDGIIDYCEAGPDLDQHAFDVLAKIRKELFDTRTGINRAAEEKRKSALELRRTLPEEIEILADWGGRANEAQVAKDDAVFELTTARNEVSKTQVRDEQAVADTCAAELQKIDAEYVQAVRKLETAANEARALARQTKADRLHAIGQEAAAKIREKETEAGAKIEALTTQIAQAREKADNSIRTRQARDMVIEQEGRAQRLESDSTELSKAIEKLDELKASLVRSLPIAGVEVQDGEVLVDGVPFDRANEARKVDIAIEIAKLRAGELPLICVDGLECLDATSFDAFVEKALASGLQFFVSRVTRGPLTIETV